MKQMKPSRSSKARRLTSTDGSLSPACLASSRILSSSSMRDIGRYIEAKGVCPVYVKASLRSKLYRQALRNGKRNNGKDKRAGWWGRKAM